MEEKKLQEAEKVSDKAQHEDEYIYYLKTKMDHFSGVPEKDK